MSKKYIVSRPFNLSEFGEVRLLEEFAEPQGFGEEPSSIFVVANATGERGFNVNDLCEISRKELLQSDLCYSHLRPQPPAGYVIMTGACGHAVVMPDEEISQEELAKFQPKPEPADDKEYYEAKANNCQQVE